MTNNRMSGFYAKSSPIAVAIYVVAFILIRVVVAQLFHFINQHFENPQTLVGIAETDNIIFDFALIVIIAPVIETYFIQYLPFKYLSQKVQPLYIIFSDRLYLRGDAPL